MKAISAFPTYGFSNHRLIDSVAEKRNDASGYDRYTVAAR